MRGGLVPGQHLPCRSTACLYQVGTPWRGWVLRVLWVLQMLWVMWMLLVLWVL